MKFYTSKSHALFVAIFCGIVNLSQAQSVNWNWLSQTSGVGGETSQGAVTDAQGNVYHAGSFSGSFTIEGTTVQSWGGPLATNGYVSRYAPNGPASNNWTLVVGSKGNNTPLGNIRGLCVDAAGNTYFWYYEFNLNFSGDTIQIGPNHHWLKPPPLGIMSLLIKVDPQGNVAWFKPFHHTGAGMAEPIYTATNSQGDLYIAGGFPSSLTLDTISLSNGGHFIAKANANGDFVWAKSFNGSGRNFDIEVNDQDELFVSATWDDDTLFIDNFSVVNPTPGAGYDRYIAKFNSAGQTQWLVNEGGQGVEYAATLAPKASGGIMCLSIMDTAANLVLDGGNVTLTPPGVVLTQYDAQGNFQSFTQYPISSKINEFSIYLGCVLTGDGTDFYMSALYTAPQVVLGTTTLTNAGGASGTADAVLAKIDTTGAVLWATNIGSDEEEEVFSLDYSSANGLTLAGSTSSSELILGNDTVVNAGFLTNEAFVANLRYSGIGLTEYHTRKTINAYPNPTSGVLHFNLEEGQQNTVQVSVQNMLGQTVLNESLNTLNGTGSLDVDFLATGVYLLNIMDGNKLYTGKFIKE